MSYSAMAPASKQALEREARAKDLFVAAKASFEKEILPSLPVGKSHTIIPLLTPNIHLTSHTFGTFHKWVKQEHAGWKLKRREATKEEAKAHHAYSRGKCYFVDAIFENPEPEKVAKRQKATIQRANKKLKAEEERNKPPKYTEGGPFPLEKMESNLQQHILGFAADVSTMNSLMRTSKHWNFMVDRDEFWGFHLNKLLRKSFDGAIYNCEHIVPLSERPQHQSTQFRAWYRACLAGHTGGGLHIRKNAINVFVNRWEGIQSDDQFEEQDQRNYPWMFTNVSPKEYYKGARAMAVEAQNQADEDWREMCEQTNRCVACGGKWHSCSC